MKKVNWNVFAGSSSCEAGLAEFATGTHKSFAAFRKSFGPGFADVRRVIDAMAKEGVGIDVMRKRAARAFKRITGLSISGAYGSFGSVRC